MVGLISNFKVDFPPLCRHHSDWKLHFFLFVIHLDHRIFLGILNCNFCTMACNPGSTHQAHHFESSIMGWLILIYEPVVHYCTLNMIDALCLNYFRFPQPLFYFLL